MPFVTKKKEDSKPADKPAAPKKGFNPRLLLIPAVIVVVGLFLFGFVRSRMSGGNVLKQSSSVASTAEMVTQPVQQIAAAVNSAAVEPVKQVAQDIKRYYFGMDD